MQADLLIAIRNATVGQHCAVKRCEHGWGFTFGGGFDKGGCGMFVEAPWRIIKDGKILLTAADDGQRFGLPRPVDAEAAANKTLRRRKVTEFEIDRQTSDVRVDFSGGVRLQILTNSAGYEAWNASFRLDDQDVTLIGGGEISYVNIPAGTSPNMVRGKPLPSL